MSPLRSVPAALLLLLVLAPAPAQDAPPKQPQEALVNRVKESIDKGVRFLRDLENNRGDFEHTSLLVGRARPGGLTALATVALLQSGVPADDPLVQRCLKYLRALAPSQSYTVGLQTMAFCLANQPQDRERIQKNLNWIKDNYNKYDANSIQAAGWGYETGSKSPDHSINQYVLLGIHEARLAGFPVDQDLLRNLYAYYNPPNHPGQWNYRSDRGATLTMTTAGLCNLLIAGQDTAAKRNLRDDGSDPRCGNYSDQTTVIRALEYIGRVYPNDIKRAGFFPHPFYTLYGIERAGRLTGRRYFGPHDWYRVGCEYLVDIQQPDGSWKGNGGFDPWPPVATSMALLFLSKGRTPVLISKLTHGTVGAAKEGWDNKRHDVRHVVDFASRELFERQPLAWQVFDVRRIEKDSTALAEELLQTPIVYINGHSLSLQGKQEKMLREYLQNGGFLFAEACCNEKQFDRDFRALVKSVTGSELAPLPSTHPVYNAAGKFRLTERDAKEAQLEGVQQGCKTVVVYSPRALAGYWENNDSTSPKGKMAFSIAANVIAYATGMELPRPRLTEVEIVKPGKGPRPPRGYLRPVHLKLGVGQPLAPRAMETVMAELGKSRLEVHLQPMMLTLTDERVLDYKFFYLHDRNAFRMPQGEALENLKFTLENGGLLLADAACGSKAFDRAFREMVKALGLEGTDPATGKSKPLELVPVDPTEEQKPGGLYSRDVNGFVIKSVRCRREENDGRPSKDFQDGPPRLEGVKRNGRWIILYSKYDIGCALENHVSIDCLGHDLDSAKTLARAAVLYSLRR